VISDPEDREKSAWRVSRLCHTGNCVRVAVSGNNIVLGDSKLPDGPVLSYTRDEWVAFVEGVKLGDFDNLS
jgi:hypothetical protein